MGALLGLAAALTLAALELRGFRSLFSPMLETGTFAVVLVSLSAWTAVGAGLSGFILINVERAPHR